MTIVNIKNAVKSSSHARLAFSNVYDLYSQSELPEFDVVCCQ